MIYLLTHEREILKRSNTGRLALSSFPNDVKQIVWARKSPDTDLMASIERGNCVLVFPCSEEDSVSCLSNNDSYVSQDFIILDATWQEARKIFNKSHYLHNLPTLDIAPSAESIFTLRRNQKNGGLCTAEVIAHLFSNAGQKTKASALMNQLADFIDTYHHKLD